MNLQESTHALIERAGRRGADIVNVARPFVQSGIAVAVTRPGTFIDPDVDPETGFPVEAQNDVFRAGDVCGVKVVG